MTPLGTNNGTVSGTIGYTNGEVGQAFSLNGASGYVSIPDSPSLGLVHQQHHH